MFGKDYRKAKRTDGGFVGGSNNYTEHMSKEDRYEILLDHI